MTNSFCKHLSNGYRIQSQGGDLAYRPCCYWEGPLIPFDPVKLTAQRQFLDKDTAWLHPECGKCKVEEEFKPGYRHFGNTFIGDDLESGQAGWIDLQLDTTCNGGCLICGPELSSFWRSEVRKMGEATVYSKTNHYAEVDTIFDSVDTSKLGLLQFLGGEPFLSSIDSYAIDKVTNPADCILKYTTNGSIYPGQQRIDAWKKFKRVSLVFSVDAIGARFDYLRHPLKWDAVAPNIRRIIDELGEHGVYRINHSVTPLNILYYDEFESWMTDNMPLGTSLHLHPAYGVMSPDSCTEQLREVVLDKYGIDHALYKMLGPAANNSDAMTYMSKMDTHRGLDWRTVFPEVSRLTP